MCVTHYHLGFQSLISQCHWYQIRILQNFSCVTIHSTRWYNVDWPLQDFIYWLFREDSISVPLFKGTTNNTPTTEKVYPITAASYWIEHRISISLYFLWGESTSKVCQPVISFPNGPVMQKSVLCHDVIMNFPMVFFVNHIYFVTLHTRR